MKAHHFMLLSVSLALFLAGCAGRPTDKGKGGADTKPAAGKAGQDEKAEIQANLAKLPPEDRKLAETQKFCPVEEDNLLGSMGAPIKVMIKDQPVFLCCKSCRKKALADPDKTLAKVRELKAKAEEKAK